MCSSSSLLIKYSSSFSRVWRRMQVGCCPPSLPRPSEEDKEDGVRWEKDALGC